MGTGSRAIGLEGRDGVEVIMLPAVNESSDKIGEEGPDSSSCFCGDSVITEKRDFYNPTRNTYHLLQKKFDYTQVHCGPKASMKRLADELLVVVLRHRQPPQGGLERDRVITIKPVRRRSSACA